MRALVLAGFALFGAQLVAAYAIEPQRPASKPHLVLGVGFLAVGALLLLKARWPRAVAALWLALTVGGRIHFLVKSGVWTASHVAPAAVFVAWAIAAFAWLVRYNPAHARN